MGRGDESLMAKSRSHDQDGRHASDGPMIDYNR